MPSRLGKSIAVLGLMLAALPGGCSHVPVTSMLQLARIDVASTDPELLRAAVKIPRALRLKPHGNMLRIMIRLRSGEEEVQEFALQEVADPSDEPTLGAERDGKTRIVAYRIDAAEVAKLTAFRDRLVSRQRAAGASGGALSISVRPQVCRTGDLADGPIHITTYLRTQETGGYVPLTRNVDLHGLYPSTKLATLIAPCE